MDIESQTGMQNIQCSCLNPAIGRRQFVLEHALRVASSVSGAMAQAEMERIALRADCFLRTGSFEGSAL